MFNKLIFLIFGFFNKHENSLLKNIYSKKYFLVIYTIFNSSFIINKKLKLDFFISYEVKVETKNNLVLYNLFTNIVNTLKNVGFFTFYKSIKKKIEKFTVLRSVFADKKFREQLSRSNFSLNLVTKSKKINKQSWFYLNRYLYLLLYKNTNSYFKIKQIKKCVNY